MSFEAMAWATKQKTQKPVDKLLLLMLASYAGPDGESWPSQARLADDMSATERTVRESLKRLEAGSFLTRKARRDKRGQRSSDIIKLSLTEKISPCENATGSSDLPPENISGRSESQPENISIPTGKKRPNQPENISGYTVIEPIIEPKNPLTPSREGEDFLSFDDLMKMGMEDRLNYLTENHLKPSDYQSTYRAMGINPRSLAGTQRPRKRTTDEIMQAVFAEEARRKAMAEQEAAE